MRQAVIEQIGTPEEIYIQPQTHFVATFVGTVNQFPGILTNASTGSVLCNRSDLTISVEPVTDSSLKEGQAVIVFVRPEEIQVNQMGTISKASIGFRVWLKASPCWDL